MKLGKTLTELAIEIDRQARSKRDFITESSTIEMMTIDHDGVHVPMLQLNNEQFGIRDTAHAQFADRLSIPKKYYDRMLTDAPELLRENVNHWLATDGTRRMIRTLDGNVRAILSDKYRRMDSYELLENVLPTLTDIGNENGGLQIVSSELTERKLYLKALFPRISRAIKVGDVVQSGIVISNSEIGFGSLRVEPLVFRLVCSNGLISNRHSLKKYHVGRVHDENFELYRDDTLSTEDQLLWRKVRDIVAATVDEVKFESIVSSLKDATGVNLVNPQKTVELISDMFTLTNGEQAGVLQRLIEGKDFTQYGLLNAVTRHSQDVDSYDRATELEQIGGEILALDPSILTRVAA